ncbi:cap-specific mRNA (nucleoside-2'-O-)-methyltransferase 2 [Eucyclogobius newberryi]|uniref:cap-specific mRNA (nucleoside-2'-O-)-methyltransferase 2 n=1 Tax=Eucyclogobius newberryi TaxID=166745 RepID=UPI003B597314
MNMGNGTRRKAVRQTTYSAVDADSDTLAETKCLFSKIWTYTKPSNGDWCTPEPNVSLRYPPSEHSHLEILKTSLNAVKNQLSDKNVQVWHQHTNSTNRAGKVINAVRSVANAEMCTQAWCKFYEILGTFDLIPEQVIQNGELNTVHLCEAPGAFISALNHYVKTSEKTRYVDWSWAANTLNPYHEANGGGTTIADDRLIANTLPWWFFGSDNTGNIMIQKHLLELQAFIANMCRVDLVTADGSFDCQENPDEQEALVASLHYCEVTAALLLLSPGGSFVVKMFTLYEHSSVCLLYLLNCCFQGVHVFKPATSKAGNSEVYVVCLHYEAKETVRPLLSKLIRNYGPNLANLALFPNTVIPDTFMKQHEEMCLYFHKLQVETISENLKLFKSMSPEERQRLDHIRIYVAQEYLQRFEVRFLPRSRWISRNAVSPACCTVSAGRPLGQKKQTGSFNERRELQTMTWRERIHRNYYAECVQRHLSEPSGTGCVLQGPLINCQVTSWYITIGSALPAVKNSPFCQVELLSHLNEALGSVQKLDWTQVSPCASCHVPCPGSVLSDVARLCIAGGNSDRHKRQCLVFGSHSVWEPFHSLIGDFDLTFCAEASFPQISCILLHDGEPLYQQELLNCVVVSLMRLRPGDALLLPLFSALTRVAAAVVLCLHMCFRLVSFRCPCPTSPVGAVLICIDFCPEASVKILPILKEVQTQITQLLQDKNDTGTSHRQVLQFVPIEELLTQGLAQFLCSVNSEIIQQKLHLLMQS